MDIHLAGSRPTRRGPKESFTGTVWQDPIITPQAPARVVAARVAFEPGARTAWHTHPLGQTLYVVSGIGRVQTWGGPIREIRPGDAGRPLPATPLLAPPRCRRYPEPVRRSLESAMTALSTFPDAAGRFGPYGGRYVPETLIAALDQLDREYAAALADDGLLALVQLAADHHERRPFRADRSHARHHTAGRRSCRSLRRLSAEVHAAG